VSAHRLVTLQFGPNALTGRYACGATIIEPRGKTMIRCAVDHHRTKRTSATGYSK
jgi:hypothetical protein